jgi:hypothetical protein
MTRHPRASRHPKHDSVEHAERWLKGSSEDRLNAEAFLAAGGKLLLRQRGDKKLFAQPRNLIQQPATYDGKWGSLDIRHIRAIKGVGRPVTSRSVQKKRSALGEFISRWGF